MLFDSGLPSLDALYDMSMDKISFTEMSSPTTYCWMRMDTFILQILCVVPVGIAIMSRTHANIDTERCF